MSGIWVFLLGGAGVLFAAVWLGREALRNGIIVAAAGLFGLLAYAFSGSPGTADMPYLTRQAELSAVDPAAMTLPEALSRLEHVAQIRPDDPQPHVFIGDLMKAQRRYEEAIRAYQSALRRDGALIPALLGLADTLTQQDNGRITEQTQSIYARVFSLDNEQLRAGFMVGLSDWQAGRKIEAETSWSGLQQLVSEGEQRAVMLDAWIDGAKSPQ